MIKSWTYVLRKMNQHIGTPMKPNIHDVLQILPAPQRYSFHKLCELSVDVQ
jgi:hypothetical protein